MDRLRHIRSVGRWTLSPTSEDVLPNSSLATVRRHLRAPTSRYLVFPVGGLRFAPSYTPNLRWDFLLSQTAHIELNNRTLHISRMCQSSGVCYLSNARGRMRHTVFATPEHLPHVACIECVLFLCAMFLGDARRVSLKMCLATRSKGLHKSA